MCPGSRYPPPNGLCVCVCVRVCRHRADDLPCWSRVNISSLFAQSALFCPSLFPSLSLSFSPMYSFFFFAFYLLETAARLLTGFLAVHLGGRIHPCHPSAGQRRGGVAMDRISVRPESFPLSLFSRALFFFIPYLSVTHIYLKWFFTVYFVLSFGAFIDGFPQPVSFERKKQWDWFAKRTTNHSCRRVVLILCLHHHLLWDRFPCSFAALPWLTISLF